jgi:glycosyltransferase involved in cell wall biosynthesis
MTTPLVSIVLLTYRHEAFVAEAIRSLLKQDWPNFEIIIADDGSPDRTSEVIRETLASAQAAVPVRLLLSEVNHGLATNWNRAVEAAAGEVIVASAGDDTSDPERVRRSMELFAADPDCQALYFSCRTMDAEGRTIENPWRPIRQIQRRALDAETLWKGFNFNGATAAYRTRMLRAFGPIDPRCGTEDVSSLVRAQLLGSAVVSPEVLVSWRWHGANLSHGSKVAGVTKALRIKAKLRQARGAYHDGRQLVKDASSAASISKRSSQALAAVRRSGNRICALSRLKFHSLHPRSRWGVLGILVARLLASADVSKAEAIICSVKAVTRRLSAVR